MKCLACDKILSDFEATRRYSSEGEFIDLCNHCFHESDFKDIVIIEREDLQTMEYDEESEVGHE